MAITNGQYFNVVQVSTLAKYNDITSKLPNTAYWVVEVKKIYLDGTPYGFSSDDITATILSGLLESLDSTSIGFTLSIVSGKVRITGAVKLATSVRQWVLSNATDYANASTKYNMGDSFNNEAEFVSSVNSTYPPASSTLGAVARGSDGTLPLFYWYRKLTGTSPNLLKSDSTGLNILQSDVEDLIVAMLNANIFNIKGVAGGFAELDSGGKVPTTQLPSYVDDILEYATLTGFPATGETGKIYVAQDTGKVYRWTGTAFVNIATGNLVLGETSDTAYRGDRGKTAYDHSQSTGTNPHAVTKSNVGLGSVQNYGIATQSQAEDGLLDNVYMTPLKVAYAIGMLSQKVTWTVVS